MQTGSEIVGKPVVSVDNGEMLGKVRDLYFDRQLEKLVALSLGGGGLFGVRSKVVHLSNVNCLGEDVVLVESSTTVYDDSEIEERSNWQRRSKIRGRKVETPGGTPIGTIDDITIDHDGRIRDYTLAWTQVGGPIGRSHLLLREAVLDPGSETGVMMVDLRAAEEHASVSEESTTDRAQG
jgi:uncharacterized protein YrrD